MSMTFLLCVVAIILILPFAFCILDLIIRNHPKKRMFSIAKSFWFVYGSFTRASVDIVPSRISARFLAITMWTASLLIITAYIAGKIT